MKKKIMNKAKSNFKKDLFSALSKGRLKSIKNISRETKKAKTAAENYLTKNARINIRLSQPDLTLIKRIAAEQGMPYQTLISSLLHRFITGRIAMRDTLSEYEKSDHSNSL